MSSLPKTLRAVGWDRLTCNQADNSIAEIIKVVGEEFCLGENDIRGRSRTQHIAIARQICFYLARRRTHYPLGRIGMEFSNRDHGTVLHGYQTIARDVVECESRAKIVARLETKLNNIAANLTTDANK